MHIHTLYLEWHTFRPLGYRFSAVLGGNQFTITSSQLQ